MENINVIKKYGIIEFYKNDSPMYRLSKNKNSDCYSILDYTTGVISFFIPNWDKKRLIKEYTKILSE